MTEPDDNTFDEKVDEEIEGCLNLEKPRSFFTFAGAGSGKTRSLELALKSVKRRYGSYLRMHGKFVAVITYTKAAANEISKRVEFDPIIRVSTIHSFVWDLIKGFDADIRESLREKLKEDIRELQQEQSKAKDLNNKTSIKRAQSIKSKEAKIEKLESIKRFFYSPEENQPSRGSLNHADVIYIASALIASNDAMQEILIRRFPILLIDESQDTNADLMEAFMKVQAAYMDRFIVGLFGDMMQRIYNDGKKDLGSNLPKDWATPTKLMNHRCPARVVELINAVRMTTDRQQQRARKDKTTGIIRLFLLPNNTKDKGKAEADVARQMGEICGDPKWNETGASVKRLILEHHMASTRMGFTELFFPLYEVDDLRTGALDGSLSGIVFFTSLIQPVVNGRASGDEFVVANTVRKHSPLLSKKRLLKAGVKREQILDIVNQAVDDLCALWNNGGTPTLKDILKIVAKSKLFTIPECFSSILASDELETDDESTEELSAGDGNNDEEESKALAVSQAWEKFLEADYRQLEPYKLYVSGEGGFGTHQGVKGLEFPRVMVIMDDEGSRGNSFSYERLFGAKSATPSEVKALKEGRETGLDKTKRLFYVTCSRAEESLALVAYTADPASVRNEAVRSNWFFPSEIIQVPSVQ